MALFWNVVGDLEVLVTPPQLTLRHYDQLKPELRVRWGPDSGQALYVMLLSCALEADSASNGCFLSVHR